MRKKEFDYLIVGSGLFGSVFANKVSALGYKCLVIDKRNHIGGNVFCNETEGINVHQYGPHIFHTNDEDIWNYVNQFVSFNHFRYSPIARYRDEQFNLPFNMNTFYQLWKVKTPEEAMKKIAEQKSANCYHPHQNLEEHAIQLVGIEIYEKLIKGYTQKQWGRLPKDLPSFIIKRIPFRFTYDNNYFNDRFQGIPIGGYNKLINGLLKNIEVRKGIDYLANRAAFDNLADKIVYTGQIDAFFDYKFGKLEYRSLRFDHKLLAIENFQGNAVVNYTDIETPFTRIIEHKHFEFGTQHKTMITYEFPQKFEHGCEPYYPINDETNNTIYKKYQALGIENRNIIFGGRLAEYKYYDMHQVIASALNTVRKINASL